MLASAETTLLKNKGEFPLVENPSEKKITSEQPVKMQLRSPNDENEELSEDIASLLPKLSNTELQETRINPCTLLFDSSDVEMCYMAHNYDTLSQRNGWLYVVLAALEVPYLILNLWFLYGPTHPETYTALQGLIEYNCTFGDTGEPHHSCLYERLQPSANAKNYYWSYMLAHSLIWVFAVTCSFSYFYHAKCASARIKFLAVKMSPVLQVLGWFLWYFFHLTNFSSGWGYPGTSFPDCTLDENLNPSKECFLFAGFGTINENVTILMSPPLAYISGYGVCLLFILQIVLSGLVWLGQLTLTLAVMATQMYWMWYRSDRASDDVISQFGWFYANATSLMVFILFFIYRREYLERKAYINDSFVRNLGLSTKLEMTISLFNRKLNANIPALQNRNNCPCREDDVPSYWVQNTDDSRIDVTATFRGVLQHLIDKTVLEQYIGTGRDTRARVKPYSGLKIKKVFLLQNIQQWRLYKTMRETVAQERRSEGVQDKILTLTSEALDAGHGKLAGYYQSRDLRNELHEDCNEAFLFHGTRAATVPLIERSGIDQSFGRLDGLFGAGNYFAENASKADQYCTPDPEQDGCYAMLISRVCLGSPVGGTGRNDAPEPVVPPTARRLLQKIAVGDPSKYIRNPQAVAAKFVKKNKGKAQYNFLHSVIGKGINANDGLEFVVYKGTLCYPEFLVYYERVECANPSECCMDEEEKEEGGVEGPESAAIDDDDGTEAKEDEEISELESLRNTVEQQRECIVALEEHLLETFTKMQKQMIDSFEHGKRTSGRRRRLFSIC